jgi:hypothetical protein
LLTSPADDHVGRLTATQAAVPAPRPVEFVYDEVPATPPAGTAAPFAAEAAVASDDAPSVATTTSTTALTPSGGHDDAFESHGDDQVNHEDHADEDSPDSEHEIEDD